MGDKLAGRVAAITGGSAGIGLGIAAAFVAEGASVSLMARNPEKGAQAAASLGVGERAIFIQGDAMVQADVEGFVDQTVERLGQVDILVNNAGGAGDLRHRPQPSDRTRRSRR